MPAWDDAEVPEPRREFRQHGRAVAPAERGRSRRAPTVVDDRTQHPDVSVVVHDTLRVSRAPFDECWSTTCL